MCIMDFFSKIIFTLAVIMKKWLFQIYMYNILIFTENKSISTARINMLIPQ